ncbi:MAG: ABC transporter permease [Anaerolineae bacterium]|nr:ABC transporter permease [Anaerolineae bacterium]
MYTIPNRKYERRHRQPVVIQLMDLVLIELTNWRWSWRGTLLGGMLTPLFTIVTLGVFARDGGSEALAYVMTGNMVVSLLFGTMGNVQGHIEWLRFQGGLDYFATLPIWRYVLIVAIVLAFMLFALPSLAVTMCLGSLVLRVPIKLHLLILIVIPLCALALAGVGALLGLLGRTPGESSRWNSLLTLVMITLGPVVIPPDRLPGFALALGYLSPATYAASALRQVVIGPLTGRLALDLAVLAAMTVLFLWLVGRKMSWREE